MAVRQTHLLAAVGMSAFLGLVLLAGCNLKPAVSDLKVDPPTFSPNADGLDDVTRISYSIGRNADIDLYFVGPDGEKRYFRQGERRVPGDYFVLFGGAVDNQLLPDGSYTCTVEAKYEGSSVTAETSMTIKGGDQIPLQLTKLAVYPDTFTPNRDGINDRVRISYYLNKDADAFVSLVSADGKSTYPIPPELITKPGVKGSHEHDYDAGVDLGAKPPPDGLYTIVAEAVDAVGNRVRATAPLTIAGGGVPMAEIVNRAADWAPKVVPIRSTLTFTCTVENIGPVPIRTKGPQPGTTYNTHQNYSTFGFFEEPGIFRLGADSEGNTEGRKYPFRWQLGRDDELTTIDGQKYLMPGQRATIVGHIQIEDKPPKVNPKYWLGLVHEQVEIVNDFVEVVELTVDY